jgi:hypothetical protein
LVDPHLTLPTQSKVLGKEKDLKKYQSLATDEKFRTSYLARSKNKFES